MIFHKFVDETNTYRTYNLKSFQVLEISRLFVLRKKGNIDDINFFFLLRTYGKDVYFLQFEDQLGGISLLGKYRVGGNFKSLIFDF